MTVLYILSIYIYMPSEVFFFLKMNNVPNINFNFRITEMSYVDVWKVSSLHFVCLSNMCVDFLEWYLVWMCRFASPDCFVACGQWTVTDVWVRVFRGHSESLHYAWKAFRQRAWQAPSCQFIWFELWNGVMKCETSGLKCFDYPHTLWPSISISPL